MQMLFSRALALSALLAVWAPGLAAAQSAPPEAAPAGAAPVVLTTTPCGSALSAPAAEPPAGQQFVWIFEPCFDKQGNSPTIETETYLYYIKLKDLVSRPSQGVWVPYDDKVEQTALSDF